MKVLCILTDGFEELEAVGTVALLRRAGIDVDICAIDATTACGRFQISLNNLKKLDTIESNDYDALFLPGGPHYQKLEENEEAMSILASFMDKNKFVCCICAAPTILGHKGYLKNRNYTCYTSMNEEFGGTYIDKYTACDGNLITGRSAAAVIDFSFLIIEKLLGKEKSEEAKKSIYYY